MNLDTQIWCILAGIVVLALIAIAAWFFYQKKQSQRLKQRFGPEYGRTVDDLGSRTKAESELKTREMRVEHLNILPLPLPLPAPEAARFNQGLECLARPLRRQPQGCTRRGGPIGSRADAQAWLPHG